VLTLVFLPAMYTIWFQIRPSSKDQDGVGRVPNERTWVADRADAQVSAS
jgi:hypothetical protein